MVVVVERAGSSVLSEYVCVCVVGVLACVRCGYLYLCGMFQRLNVCVRGRRVGRYAVDVCGMYIGM